MQHENLSLFSGMFFEEKKSSVSQMGTFQTVSQKTGSSIKVEQTYYKSLE